MPADTLDALRELRTAGATITISAPVPLGWCQSRDCNGSADVVLVTKRPELEHRDFVFAVRVCLGCCWDYAHSDLKRGATTRVMVPAAATRSRAA